MTNSESKSITTSQKGTTHNESGCHIRIVHLERVALAKRQALAEEESERLALTYKILGDPTRLKIVMALNDGEMCVCDLAAFLGLSESAVSHQLRRLKDLALVRQRRQGQTLFYALNDSHIAAIINIGLEHIREGGRKWI
ncbi:metalloregulator ArsR/SmtB family transcription factor [Desulfococcaceae bacterium HSG7]|nr:metalloregulator ArsR/SmtB family transcription factor [Desulfococcaceae bacterium HSG7]